MVLATARPSPLVALAAAACALLQGCVYLPSTISVYDSNCQIEARHLILQQYQVAEIRSCQNQGCIGLVIAGAATAAATAIVSGSIVIAGNVAYWVEKQASCVRSR